MSDHIKRLAAVTALNEMLAGSSPSICTIDRIGTMLGIEPKRAVDAYNILHTLHCVHYAKMPLELRNQIPALIQQCLGVEPTFQFEQASEVLRTKIDSIVSVIEAAEKPKRPGIMRLLGVGS